MKIRTLQLLVCLFLTGTLAAQNWLPPMSVANSPTLFGMNVKSVGLSFGVDEDRLGALDGRYLASKAKGVDALAQLDNGQLEKEYAYSMICENPQMRLDVALQPRFMPNADWRFAVVGIFNRIDAISYRNREATNQYQYLNISEYSNEIALESSMLWRAKTKGSFLRLYGGGGTNIGASFGSSLYIDGTVSTPVTDLSGQLGGRSDAINVYRSTGSDTEHISIDVWDAREALSHRLFAQAGIGFNFFRRLEIGLEGRWGYGYRLVGGAPPQWTNLRSFSWSARWNLIN